MLPRSTCTSMYTWLHSKHISYTSNKNAYGQFMLNYTFNNLNRLYVAQNLQFHWFPISQRCQYQLAIVTYKTWFTGTIAYLLNSPMIANHQHITIIWWQWHSQLMQSMSVILWPWSHFHTTSNLLKFSGFHSYFKQEMFYTAYSIRKHST